MSALQQAQGIYQQATSTAAQGYWPAAVELYQMATQQFAAAGATAEQALSLYQCARYGWLATHDNCDPAALLHQAAQLYQELGDHDRQAAVLTDLALYLFQQGENGRAATVAGQALTLAKDAALQASVWRLLGRHALQQEKLAQAETCFLRAAHLSKTAGDLLGQAHSIGELARLALGQEGHSEFARRLLQQAYALVQRRATEQPRQAFVQQALVPLLLARDLPDMAHTLATAAEISLADYDQRLAALFL